MGHTLIRWALDEKRALTLMRNGKDNCRADTDGWKEWEEAVVTTEMNASTGNRRGGSCRVKGERTEQKVEGNLKEDEEEG